MEDVIYLTDGSVLRGRVVERRADESVLIRTRDDNVIRVARDQVERIARESRFTPRRGLGGSVGLGAVSVRRASTWRR